MRKQSLLFFGKQHDVCCAHALELVRTLFPETAAYVGTRGEPFPHDALSWQGDYVLSYLSPWIIPESVLNRASVAALNFHPGPPEYPGIGCTNFALYNGETRFGVVCHHMAPRVDTGPIVQVSRFPIYPEDSVWTLTQRCYAYLLPLFQDIIACIAEGRPLPAAECTWTRRPYTRRELNALCRIAPDMSEAEVQRRVRAVTFPNAPGAHVEMAGCTFRYQPDAGGGNVI